jgi:MoxR-like ATPase
MEGVSERAKNRWSPSETQCETRTNFRSVDDALLRANLASINLIDPADPSFPTALNSAIDR